MHRAADRFALVGYAGEQAIAAGILPWPPLTAVRAAKSCFDAWIAHRGGAGQLEHERGVANVIRFLKMDRARFETLLTRDTPPFPVRDRVGFVSECENLYYVFPEAWEEVCGSSNGSAVASELNKRGYLVTEKSGRGLQKRMKLGGLPKQRYYVLRFPDGKPYQPPREAMKALIQYVEGSKIDEDNNEGNNGVDCCCPA